MAAKSEGSQEQARIDPRRLFIIVGVVVILLWSGVWAWSAYWYPPPEDRGTFGDSFGFVNSLFSGLAFAGVIISIYYQSQELRDTREELKGAKAAQQEMARISYETYRLAIAPILVPSSNPGDYYSFENIGKGPALNLRLFTCGPGSRPDFRLATLLEERTSLAPGPHGIWEIKPATANKWQRLIVAYADIDGQRNATVADVDPAGKVTFVSLCRAEELARLGTNYERLFT